MKPLVAAVFLLFIIPSLALAEKVVQEHSRCQPPSQYPDQWIIYTRGGGGLTIRNGNRSTICWIKAYWDVSNSVIKKYRCEKYHKNCRYTESVKVIEVKREGDKTIYVHNKKKSTISHVPKKGASSTGLIPPPEGPPSTIEGWEEWNRQTIGMVGGMLVHYIGPKGEDACLFGEPFADYEILYGADHNVLYDQRYTTITNPLYKGEIMGAYVYDEAPLQILKDTNVSHCYKIEYTRGTSGFATFPRWYNKSRVHGKVTSTPTAIEYEIERGKVVKVTPLQACCHETEYRCLGYVKWGESCPQGKPRAGIFGNGKFTPCSMCGKPITPEPDPVEEEKVQNSPSVGCCRGGRCTPSKSALNCAVSGGIPLQPEGACPASGPDPCSPPKPKEEPGACLLKNGGCAQVKSAQACRDRADDLMFSKGGQCRAPKKGGCCDDSGNCSLTTYTNCVGTFFENECPAECPKIEGACTKYCEGNNTELCEMTTVDICSQIPGAKFQQDKLCSFRSGSLECYDECNRCPSVVGSWNTADGRSRFFTNCTGTLTPSASQRELSFKYECKSDAKIDVYYEGRQAPHKLEIVWDGDSKSLHER